MTYNVLIVDDSSIVRKALKKTLALVDVPVSSIVEAANGREGLDALAKGSFDLVFMDINMPVMNGLEFFEEAKAGGSIGQAKVIVISTDGSVLRAQELAEKGVAAQLRKPVRPESLGETIRQVLSLP